ncbi:cilia- and flagella-associated protein 251 [Trichomycterus rosablanca]|uniref:cilia- and flagella-associated protein 251 n=1 Tax=Trichomycterus rosablanca TaxID=2290929 RepID=UPI002F35A76C
MAASEEAQTNRLTDKNEEFNQSVKEQSSADKHVNNGPQKSSEGSQTEEEGREMYEQTPEDSQVYRASSLPLIHSTENSVRPHPLNLNWAFGINSSLPVFSLLDQDRLAVLYCCSHVAVIYDHTSNSQQLLQGHCSSISCVCVSEDRRWLVTATKGHDSLVIIWDSYTGIPVHTIFECHSEDGVAALALSSDSKYLVTVGAGTVQRVCVWDWTNKTDGPECQVDISPELGCQNHIMFHPTDNSQLLSNSKSHVLFYSWDKGNINYSAPEISDRTFNKAVGSFSQSVFHFGGTQALSVTLAGKLVLWEVQKGPGACPPQSAKATKLIPLQTDGITVMCLCDSFIVTGDVRGRVTFYDENFRLVYCYSEFSSDPIVSISFSKEICSGISVENQEDRTLNAKSLVSRNFVISTASAAVIHVKAQGSVAQTLLKEHSESLSAVACHPKQPLVAMGSHSGILKIWDYERKVAVLSRIFHTEKRIQCITYDPQGFYLAVGFASGTVQVLDACTLQSEGEEDFHLSQDSITHLTFSHNSSYLATADTGKTVMVFYLCKEGSPHVWKYLGKHRSHYKSIQDLMFGVNLDTNEPRLLSLGMDRRLVEYDLQNSKNDELFILGSERIEQTAVPTCMAWYPPLTMEHFLITASDHYKMKLLNATTKMCRKTVLGPAYGSPVKKMLILPPSKDGDPNSHYMAYITQDKVGLQMFPLDGNPYKSSALICHSMGVSSFACSHDNRYIFTAGGEDRTVFSWEISLPALEAAAALGGKDPIPFYTLLEGGKEGELFRAIEDLFYYCQLRNQGIDSMETRRVSNRIPLSEVPDVIRALGFYPTEQELENMLNEVKFSRYAETGKYTTDVDLDEFIKLYVNHRPVFGITRKELYNVFQVLGTPDENGKLVIPREELPELLQSRGEPMTEEELAGCFMTLLGSSTDGGRSEVENSECKDSELPLESKLPPHITLDTLATEILGFSIGTEEHPPEPHLPSSMTS